MSDEKPKNKAEAFASGCAGAAGKATGELLVWGLFIWIFWHKIVEAAAWVAAHVRIV